MKQQFFKELGIYLDISYKNLCALCDMCFQSTNQNIYHNMNKS